MDRPRFRRYFRHGLLPQLIAFEACLRLGGVTRAAEELCLAQPTVSGLLKRLADTFGEPVLVARGGRMQLTAAGREVAALCDDIFASFERFEERRNWGQTTNSAVRASALRTRNCGLSPITPGSMDGPPRKA